MFTFYLKLHQIFHFLKMTFTQNSMKDRQRLLLSLQSEVRGTSKGAKQWRLLPAFRLRVWWKLVTVLSTAMLLLMHCLPAADNNHSCWYNEWNRLKPGPERAAESGRMDNQLKMINYFKLIYVFCERRQSSFWLKSPHFFIIFDWWSILLSFLKNITRYKHAEEVEAVGEALQPLV